MREKTAYGKRFVEKEINLDAENSVHLNKEQNLTGDERPK